MLAGKVALSLLLAAAGQAAAAFTIGHGVHDTYVDETDSTAGIKHNYSTNQGKLVVATRTLGNLTYTFMSPGHTAEPVTDSPGEVAPPAASSTATVTAAEYATVTANSTVTVTVIATHTVATHSPPALEAGGVPFHIHGGGDYTSITFYGGYGTPTLTTSTTHHTSSITEAPYHYSIDTTQHQSISTPASAKVSTAPSVTPSVTPSVAIPSSSLRPPSTLSSSTLAPSTMMTGSSPLASLSLSLSASTTTTESATTLFGLTIPAETATATESPKAVETHSHSGGIRAETAMSTILLFMALAYIFVL